MERWQLELAEAELRVAEDCFTRWGGVERAGNVLKARHDLRFARAKFREAESQAAEQAASLVASALSEFCNDLVYRPFLAQVRQSTATFLAREAAGDSERVSPDNENGWCWAVRVMVAGPSSARVEGLEGMATYIGAEVLPQLAKAVNGARFRRRHPYPSEGEGFQLPELTIGWMSDGRVEGQAVYATAHLLHNEREIREKLMAAREAGKLDLYGVSVMAGFNYTRKEVDGAFAQVATNLVRFVALDMVAEPGAGGRFLGSAGVN